MCQKRTEEETGSSMRDLYSEVLQADREMKQLIAGLPEFFGLEAVYAPGTPAHVSQQRTVLFLSFAHKVCQPISNLGSPGTDTFSPVLFNSSPFSNPKFKRPLVCIHKGKRLQLVAQYCHLTSHSSHVFQ